MKLFYTTAACSLVVRIILNELEIDFQSEKVDLIAKKTASGVDFKTINPKGAVPTLVLDNGEILTENQVIIQYLADQNNNRKLLPPLNDLRRYRVLEYLNYIATELHKSIGLFFNPNCPKEIKTVIEPLIMQKFGFINECLKNGPYLLEEEFTLADAYLYVMLRWADYFKIDLSPCKNIGRFKSKLQARPSVIQSLNQEGLS